MSIERIMIESQEELQQMISKDITLIEKDLTMICSNVSINDKATLDILSHDDNGQLVIVQLNVNEDDIMLLHGIQSWDYVDKFKSFLKATYSKHKIDDKEKPRLVLVAPSFSDALRRAVESMKGIRIDLYEWEYLKLGDHKGLRLQPIFGWSQGEQSHVDEKQTEKKREQKTAKKVKPVEAEQEKKEEPNAETTNTETLEPESNESADFAVPPIEEPTEESELFKPVKDESQKKKLRLF